MSKSIVFVDSHVANYQSLIDGLNIPTDVFILDASSDGMNQIAAHLLGQHDIDALHIISHGSEGALYLGTTVLDSSNLSSYSAQLSDIGSTLTETGDILFYGCNVAKGDAGLQFISSIAQATGADVAASDDLTGAVTEGGDWVLEANTGGVTAITVSPGDAAYAYTLQTATTSLNFSAEDKSMWGQGTALSLDVTWNDLLYTQTLSESFSNNGFSGTAEIQANAGLIAHLAASTGDVDLNYQMTVNPLLPDVVKSGEYFVFDTSSWSLTNGQLQSQGPDIASTEFTLDFLFNVSGGLKDLQYDPPLFDPILFDPLTITPINLDTNIVDIGVGDPSYELSGDYGSLNFAIPGAVTTDSGVNTSSQSLTSLVAYGLSSTPLGNLNLDLDALAHGLFPATIPSLDYSFSRGDFNLNLELLDLDANLNASVAQKFTFTPTTVWVDLTSSYMGEHRHGELGDQFIFSTPTTGSGNITISATYTIDGVLRNQTGLALNASLDVKALDLNIDGKLVGDWGFEWSPFGGPLYEGSFPEGGLSIGSPLYLYDQSYQWNGFDSETATYSVAYSASANSGGALTSTGSSWTADLASIVGSGNNDILYGNDLDNTIQGLAGNDQIYAGAGNDTIDGDSGYDLIKAGAGSDIVNEVAIAGTSQNDTLDGGSGTDTLNLDFSADSSYVHYIFYSASMGSVAPIANDSLSYIQGALTNYSAKILYSAGVTSVYATGFEKVNLTGTGGNDLLIYQNGTSYDGKAGTDTFYADWSGLSTAVNWINTGAAFTYNGAVISNVERLVLQTGSGDDNISNNAVASHDEIQTGAGNDTVSVVAVASASQNDTLDGGSGTDTLNLDFSADSSYVRNYFYKSTGEGVSLAGGDSLSGIQGALTNYSAKILYSAGVTSVYATGFEKVDLTGTGGNDLLIYQNGTSYDGKAGTDTFYADWSGLSTAVNWINTGAAFTYNGAVISNVERLVLQTGSGDDNISNNAVASHDEIQTGAGNDTVSVVAVASASQNDTLDGGSGTDTLNLDFSADSSYVRNYFYKSTGEGVSLAGGDSLSGIQGALTNYSAKILYSAGVTNVYATGFEKVNLTGTGGNDLLIYQNGTSYDGKGGMDTFYADWSSATTGVSWDNNPVGGAQTVNGVSIAGVERLLLQTGSGDDNISNNAVASHDEIQTGAGNDTVSVVAVASASQNDTLDGGSGTDTLNLDFSADSSYVRNYFYKSTGEGVSLAGGDSLSGIQGALTNYSAKILYSAGVTNVYATGFEKVNLTGTGGNDLLIYQNGTSYDGKGGMDTFYADWSSATTGVSWDNNPVGGAQTVNGVSIAGVERLLLQTGSGDDNISNNAVASHDEIQTGAGDDTINGGVGNDTMIGGLGDDSYYVDSNSDVITENATEGTDTVLSSITWTLGANLENLTLAGTTAINGTGNTLANTLIGNAQANVLSGLTGDDTLDGGAGNDTLVGGTGNDLFVVDSTSDIVTEYLNEGTDTVQSTVTYTLGDNVENLTLTGTALINGTGNTLANTLIGNAQANVLSGQSGNDTLNGGLGNDTLNGGDGTDTVDYADASSGITLNLALVTAQATGGSGSDTVLSIENVLGSAYADRLTGNALANALDGGAGADTLDGGTGSDTMDGGDGSDLYHVRDIGDVVSEANASVAVGGTDLVYSYLANYTLAANVENGMVMNATAANLVGNELGNVLYAGAGNNILSGGAGNDTAAYTNATAAVTVSLAVAGGQATGGSGTDTLAGIEHLTGSAYNDNLTGNNVANILNGGAGADTLAGGLGDDTYYIDDAGDVITEALNAGTDLAISSVLGNYTLGANVENGRITATGAASLTGNASGNILYAGAGDNSLDGGTGSDTASYQYATAAVTLSLAAGGAQVTGGSGSDTLISIEQLTGSNYNDNLTGSNGDNTLDGGLGNDTLAGGLGSDTYVVNSTTDIITEALNAGTDLVNSSAVNYTLGANLENGRILHTAASNLAGNELNNILYAGSGNNILSGFAGYDTASYQYATSAVTVSLAIAGQQNTGGSGLDTLAAIEYLTGSNYNDSLTGNGVANALNGGQGADTLTGGDGSDVYTVDNLGDIVSETNAAAAGGIDTVITYLSDYTLGVNVENGRIAAAGTVNLTGNELNNTLYAGAGNNALDGSTGNDTASYLYATAAVTVSLATAGAQATGGSGTDTLESIEYLTGSNYHDTLAGNNIANILNGGLGNDTLMGGLGNDLLTGGAGQDIFVFDTALNGATNKDTLNDFNAADDTLWLDRDIFTSLAEGSLAAGNFRSGAGVTTAADADDYLIYNTTNGYLYYDADGNGGGATAIQFATLSTHPAITAADFMGVA